MDIVYGLVNVQMEDYFGKIHLNPVACNTERDSFNILSSRLGVEYSYGFKKNKDRQQQLLTGLPLHFIMILNLKIGN